MYSQEKQFSSLAKVLSNHDRVIIDTCSLMDEGFPKFMDQLVGSKRYWKKGLKVIVPKECIEELKKHASNNDWHVSEVRIDALRALGILKDANRKHHLIGIQKKQNFVTRENFADPAILATATVLRIRYRLLVITQDKKLGSDLVGLNNLGSQNGRFLAVMKINSGGSLEGMPLKAAKQPQEKPTNEKVVAKKATPVKKVETKAKKEEVKPFFDFGLTPTEAIITSAKRIGVLIRDPSIPYLKEAHGSIDLTRDTLSKALPSKGLDKVGDKFVANINGLSIVLEKTERDFKASTSLDLSKIEPKTIEKKQEVDSLAKEAKPKDTKSKKVAEIKVEEKPVAKKTTTKKASSTKVKKEEAPLKEKPSIEAKVVTKQAAPKKTNLEKAMLLEKRLNANINNPNYPQEKKTKDIDSYIKLFDKLTNEEQSKLKLTKEALLQNKENI